ncbi:YigZ family protein [Serinibacter arcticus]|uniref:YigZ family protein n=1 Tax=Serinibacter arcticus TaxID=1655435 RepID=A0A2U1ZQX5_9MICO|nr:YigZ family protein [Serinibacter arcticus]PWD49378.1 YigZ family protein [Serinibacter arcticus]
MADVSSYRTLRSEVAAETEISRSRFLSLLSPVDGEAAARERIAAVRAAHPRARHHCTAFVLGPDGALQRTNDDGEPSGTAGAPMLEALVAGGVSDVVAVVVRYFGGVLLGTGGLTRAYRGAVALALEDADVAVRTRHTSYELVAGYAEAAVVEAEARRAGWPVTATYGADVGLRVDVPPGGDARLVTSVERATAGRVAAREVGTTWVTTG